MYKIITTADRGQLYQLLDAIKYASEKYSVPFLEDSISLKIVNKGITRAPNRLKTLLPTI